MFVCPLFLPGYFLIRTTNANKFKAESSYFLSMSAGRFFVGPSLIAGQWIIELFSSLKLSRR